MSKEIPITSACADPPKTLMANANPKGNHRFNNRRSYDNIGGSELKNFCRETAEFDGVLGLLRKKNRKRFSIR